MKSSHNIITFIYSPSEDGSKSFPLGAGARWGGLYFIGIGGIGMSAWRANFQSLGKIVSGYDKTTTALTHELEQSGIDIHYEENIDLIPKDANVVVYTPAILLIIKNWFITGRTIIKL